MYSFPALAGSLVCKRIAKWIVCHFPAPVGLENDAQTLHALAFAQFWGAVLTREALSVDQIPLGFGIEQVHDFAGEAHMDLRTIDQLRPLLSAQAEGGYPNHQLGAVLRLRVNVQLAAIISFTIMVQGIAWGPAGTG